MRALFGFCAVLLALAVAPTAHALTATLTAPSDGATFYTGSQFTAQVPWSGTFEYAPCVDANFHVGKVQRWDRTAPPPGDWPSNGGTQEGVLSGTNALFPGDYWFKATASCGLDTVYSAAVAIHVVSGGPAADRSTRSAHWSGTDRGVSGANRGLCAGSGAADPGQDL